MNPELLVPDILVLLHLLILLLLLLIIIIIISSAINHHLQRLGLSVLIFRLDELILTPVWWLTCLSSSIRMVVKQLLRNLISWLY
jgi:hypothetical protein